MPSNVNAELGQLINSMTQQILSRGTLTNLIQTYNCYHATASGSRWKISSSNATDIKVGGVRSLTRQVGREVSTVSAFEVASPTGPILASALRPTCNCATSTRIFGRAQPVRADDASCWDQWDGPKRTISGQTSSPISGRGPPPTPEQVQLNLQKDDRLGESPGHVNASVGGPARQLLLESQIQTLKSHCRTSNHDQRLGRDRSGWPQ